MTFDGATLCSQRTLLATLSLRGEAVMQTTTMSGMFRRLLSAERESPAARTVEYVGWLILAESLVLVFALVFVEQALHLPPLGEQAANYFRLVGLLVGGLGMLSVPQAIHVELLCKVEPLCLLP